MVVEARGELTFLVSVLAELLIEELVGQDAFFRKSIHAHIDFEIHILAVDNVAQVICFDNLIWEDVNLHLHVPWLGKRCLEVEVFKSSVMKHTPGVEMTELKSSFAHIRSWGANIIQADEQISDDS